MALTNNANVLMYAAINEHGIDRAVQLVMQQRPSYVTYATANVIATANLMPPAIAANLTAFKNANPDLVAKGYALVTEERPLPVLGTSGRYGLDYAVQIASAAIDFSPGGAVALPPALSPMAAQRVALQAHAIGGIWFPNAETLHGLPRPPVTPLMPDIGLDLAQEHQPVIRADTLATFSASFSIVLGANLDATAQPPVVRVTYDGLEITGVFDAALEAIIRAYANVVVQLVVLPRLTNLIPTTYRFVMPKLADGIQLPLTYDIALSTGLPNNPAFEADQAKVFLTATRVLP